mgnify:CR=1 FL=1
MKEMKIGENLFIIPLGKNSKATRHIRTVVVPVLLLISAAEVPAFAAVDPSKTGLTIMLNDLFTAAPPASVAVAVNESVVEEVTSVGFPLITPVDELSDKPPPTVPLYVIA